ncbi:MAG TPA: M90 family metallopeptidase [Rubricoccaceae bacterium]|nr:M90 family metallopeptidase [Rubricoccaceae bacterium]
MRLVRRADLAFVLVFAVLVGVVGAVLAGQLGGSAWYGLLAAAVVLGIGVRRPLRRLRVVRQPFPAPWRDWLAAHVPLYRRLDARARRRFERDVQITLAESRFEAVPGAEVTDELRLAVGAGAALLLHGRPDWELPQGRTFLFYPGTFDEEYEVEDEDAYYDGMVHPQGPVVLSVPAVEAGWARADGYNVVLHELAHLFDLTGAGADGLPSLLDPSSEGAWRALVREEMRAAQLGRSVLRRYASTDAAELFAVAVEQFFERPVRLRRHHPRLFDALVALFHLDPRPPEGEDDEAVGERRSLMARRWEEEGEA